MNPYQPPETEQQGDLDLTVFIIQMIWIFSTFTAWILGFAAVACFAVGTVDWIFDYESKLFELFFVNGTACIANSFVSILCEKAIIERWRKQDDTRPERD